MANDFSKSCREGQPQFLDSSFLTASGDTKNSQLTDMVHEEPSISCGVLQEFTCRNKCIHGTWDLWVLELPLTPCSGSFRTAALHQCLVSCSIQCHLPAPQAQGCLWMGSDSVERSCTLHQMELLVLWFQVCNHCLSWIHSCCAWHTGTCPRTMTLLGNCVTWKFVSHIQIRMWVGGGSSSVSESSPEWQMSHFSSPGSRWSVLAGEGICAASFLDLAQLFIFHRTNTKVCVDYRAAATEIYWDVVSAIIIYNSWHLPQSHSVAVPCWSIWLRSLWALHKSISHQWNTIICGI